MHDSIGFEKSGTPAVVIASSAFEAAARAQAEALGLPAARVVYVPHPIQDRSDDEMRAHADAVIDAVIGALTS